ncbi:MAG TPA: hypothetical protein VNA25_06625 [Phycisphaerae bacterium]|nr:hypothetical protein [Phycisphaerae bacterium]
MTEPTIRRDEWLAGLRESLRNDPNAVTTRELIKEFGFSKKWWIRRLQAGINDGHIETTAKTVNNLGQRRNAIAYRLKNGGNLIKELRKDLTGEVIADV